MRWSVKAWPARAHSPSQYMTTGSVKSPRKASASQSGAEARAVVEAGTGVTPVVVVTSTVTDSTAVVVSAVTAGVVAVVGSVPPPELQAPTGRSRTSSGATRVEAFMFSL